MMKSVVGYKALAVAAALTAASVTGASAVTILTDDFNSGTPTLNWGGDFVFVPAGATQPVDLVGGSVFGQLAFNGPVTGQNSVDLNGSRNAPGELSSVQTIMPGTYTLTFLLAGPAPGLPNDSRSGDIATTTISIGNWSTTLTPTTNQAYTPESFTFTTTGGKLLFAESNSTSPNVGDLLDNVTLVTASVPEPATWALMLFGFAGLGFAGYRSSQSRLALRA